jgi:hypothetical protein
MAFDHLKLVLDVEGLADVADCSARLDGAEQLRRCLLSDQDDRRDAMEGPTVAYARATIGTLHNRQHDVCGCHRAAGLDGQ